MKQVAAIWRRVVLLSSSASTRPRLGQRHGTVHVRSNDPVAARCVVEVAASDNRGLRSLVVNQWWRFIQLDIARFASEHVNSAFLALPFLMLVVMKL